MSIIDIKLQSNNYEVQAGASQDIIILIIHFTADTVLTNMNMELKLILNPTR